MLRIICLYLLLVILPCGAATSTEAQPTIKSLKEIIRLAQKNDLIQAAIYDKERESAKKSAIYGAFLPQIGVALQYEDSSQPSLFQPYKSSTAGIEASWNLFDGFKTHATYEAQKSLLQGTTEKEEDTRQKVFLQLVEEYYNFLKTIANLRVLKAQENELQANLERLESFYANELVTLDSLEAIRSQIAQNSYQINGIMLQAQIHKEQIELLSKEQFINLNEEFAKINEEFNHQNNPICENTENISLDINGISWIKTPKITADNQIPFLDSLETNRSVGDISFVSIKPQLTHELKSLQESVNALEHNIGTHNYFPKLDAFVRYAYYKYDNLYIPPIPLPISIPDSDLKGTQTAFGFSLSFPIFDTLSTLRQKEAARYDFLSAKTKLSYQKDSQKSKIRIAQNGMQNAKEKIHWTHLRAKSARISYCYAKQKFENGLISHIEYLTSLANELSARALAAESRFDYEIAKAKLIFASGASLEDFIEN